MNYISPDIIFQNALYNSSQPTPTPTSQSMITKYYPSTEADLDNSLHNFAYPQHEPKPVYDVKPNDRQIEQPTQEQFTHTSSVQPSASLAQSMSAPIPDTSCVNIMQPSYTYGVVIIIVVLVLIIVILYCKVESLKTIIRIYEREHAFSLNHSHAY